MVGVGNSAVQVAQLIVDHILEVGVIEEISQSSPESECESFVDEIEEGVDEGSWNCDHAQPYDLDTFVGTLWTKREKSLSTIALTMPPLTEAM